MRQEPGCLSDRLRRYRSARDPQKTAHLIFERNSKVHAALEERSGSSKGAATAEKS